MKVLHVISSIHRSSGGPSRSVQGLAAAECRAGVDAGIFTFRNGDKPWVDGISFVHSGTKVDSELLGFEPDIVHLHGLWNRKLHHAAVVCRKLGIQYVIAPRGMLEPWSLQQKWLKKRLARFFYQDRDLRCAAALHATAASEAEQFRRLGFKNPVIISPNGVNVPALQLKPTLPLQLQPPTLQLQLKTPTTNNKHSTLQLQLQSPTNEAVRRALFVSRMHPKKGVLELVEAWGRIFSTETQRHRGTEEGLNGNSEPLSLCDSVLKEYSWKVELVYTVSGELEKEYEAKVRARVKELGLEDQFIFTGALNDDEKWAAYARADLFVLPTYSENFGIVVAEALWAGVPVITTKGTPWSELEGNSPTSKCGWWIDVGIEPLADALAKAMSLSDEERREMGQRGHRLVEAKYTWDAVVKPMIEGYNAILEK